MQIAISGRREGLRERKRRETFHRISEAGLRLFLTKGYEATTLDEVAAEAGISRRTFFYYFKSKDEIVAAQHRNYADALRAAIVESRTPTRPIDAVRDGMMKASDRFDSPETIAIARMMRASKPLWLRPDDSNPIEAAVFEALRDMWPSKNRRERLRLVAMVSVRILRLATDSWLEQKTKRALSKYIQEAFADLTAETSTPT